MQQATRKSSVKRIALDKIYTGPVAFYFPIKTKKGQNYP